MADRSKARELPPLNASKTGGKKRREGSLRKQDESELISDADPEHKRPNKKSRTAKRKGSAHQQHRDGDAGSGGEDGDRHEIVGHRHSDGVDNMNFNENNTSKEPSGVPRTKKRATRSRNGSTGYNSSTRSLQSGRSLPLSATASGSGDVSCYNNYTALVCCG